MGHGIWALAEKRGISLGDLPEKFAADWVEQVYAFWEGWAERGFFSKQDRNRILERHLVESLFLLRESFFFYEELTGLPVSRETKILDAGSGPGVPGLLIPAWKEVPLFATLLDSSRRRLGKVEEHFPHGGRVQFLYGRAEELGGDYDLVLSRAFLPFPACAEVLCGLLAKGGIYLMLAGGDPMLEFAAKPRLRVRLRSHLENCGFVSRGTKNVHALSFLGHRHILALQKTHRPARGYPRAWKKIKESLTEWKKSSP